MSHKVTKDFSLYFLLEILYFKHLHLIWYQLLDAKLIFVYGINYMVLQNHFLKRRLFPHWTTLELCQELIGHVNVCVCINFWTPYSLPLIFVFLYPNYFSFTVSLKIRECKSTNYVLLYQRHLSKDYSKSFAFHINFRNLPIATPPQKKKPAVILIEITSNL